MTELKATVPISTPAPWAAWQRRLFTAMDQSVQPFLDHFTREDGEFIWQDEWGGGSPDDYNEPIFNWPLVYLMGGGDQAVDAHGDLVQGIRDPRRPDAPV